MRHEPFPPEVSRQKLVALRVPALDGARHGDLRATRLRPVAPVPALEIVRPFGPGYAGATPVDLAPPERHRYRSFGKRIFDVFVCLLLMPIWLPLCLLVLPFVRLDGGPALYGQWRVGRNGVPFRCWKVRTMVVDADTALADYLARDPAARAEWEATRKLTHDPRVTRLGRLLRALSIDELPQFWNVLRGDMSVVGPRPVQRDELQRYGAFLPDYLSVRPGVTGNWQVHGRNRVSYARRVQMDATYARDICFSTDLALILKTAAVVLFRHGV